MERATSREFLLLAICHYTTETDRGVELYFMEKFAECFELLVTRVALSDNFVRLKVNRDIYLAWRNREFANSFNIERNKTRD